jgi:YD repeat-containing protein
VNKSWSTATQYDALGRVISTIEPGGFETVVNYDEPQNGASVKRSGEAKTVAHHDGRGLVYEQTLEDGSSSKRFKYDALGNLREYRDEEDRPTTYVFDDLGRPIKTTYPDSVTASEQTTEQTQYEPVTGRVQAQRDRTGLWVWFEYDAGGRVTAIRTAGRESEPEEDDEHRPELVRYTVRLRRPSEGIAECRGGAAVRGVRHARAGARDQAGPVPRREWPGGRA